MEPILIFGSGGQCKVALDMIHLNQQYSVEYIVDKDAQQAELFGVKVIQEKNWLSKSNGILKGIVAIGDNHIRKMVVENIKSQAPDFDFINLIHPSAVLASRTKIGEGCFIHANVVIETDSQVGEHTIINSSASLNHDNHIGNFCSVGPGSVTGGQVHIGDHSAIGVGVAINNNIRIGANTIIGTGSVVVKNQTNNIVAFGNPCAEVRTRNPGDSYL